MSGRPRENWSLAWSLTFAVVCSTLLFMWLGHLLDGWLHTGPWLMVTGIFVGALAGFVNLVVGLLGDIRDMGAHGRTPNREDDS
jgi:F0F1-type ATP synthase assembly protein I